jgi:transglutaminase-like putative cysteine protease
MQTTTTPAAPAPPTTPAPPARAPFSLSRWFRFAPEDGYLTMILLVVVVFTTVASIQSVTPAWAPGLEVLTGTTAAGLLLGYLSVQQRLLPNWLVQILAMALGVFFAFAQTANEVAGGDRGVLWQHTRVWFQQAIVQRQSSDDNDVFLLFLAILTFLLAYISVWLVVRTRRPWLAALANGVVLLINLNSTTDDKSVFFIVLFLLATLLLLVRFTLSENMRYWRGRGLRFSPDLSWDFMQAGAIFVVIVLLLAYLLPAGSANNALADYWNSPTNPWQVLEARIAVIFNGAGGSGNGSINFFGNSLTLSSSVTLPDVPVLQYTTPTVNDDPTQYLVTETFDSYNGQNQWSSSNVSTTTYAPNVPQPSTTIYAKANNYKITIIRAMDGNHLFAPGDEAAQFSVPSQVTVNASQMPTSWSSANVVTPGQSYDAQGYVSTATVSQLSAVPYPTAAPSSTYPVDVLQEYLNSTPTNTIAPDVVATAQSVTRNASSMYEAAVDLENYLRQFRYSLTNPSPPPGADAISFFLRTQQGFCTHFATAMAIMGRALGMPTRVALGFSAGRFDNASHSYVVRGTEAHVWPQIYFAQYGWVNFEPTSSFTKFTRPVATAPGSTVTPGNNGAGASTTPTPRGGKGLPDTNFGGTGPTGHASSSPLIDVGLGVSLLIVLVLLFLALIGLWWRIIYRGLPPVSAAFARVATLGRWAGAPPKRSQTPIEYADALASVVPAERTSLRRLGEIYSRERWGGGADRESLEELPHLYDQVRLAISRVIVRRLRSVPLRRLFRRRRGLRDRYRR